MKFLHTADWHVGKTLKGRDRLDEQRAVLAEIASIAEANEVDAVLVAGDVYDLSAPSAPAQQPWSRHCCGCAGPGPRSSSSRATTITGRPSTPTGR